MSTLHGRNGRLYMGTSAAGAAAQISEAFEWQLAISRDLAEDNAFGDTWHTNLMGLQGWTLSGGGNFDTANSDPFTASTATGAVRFYLYPDISTAARYYYGLAWPLLNVTAPLGGKVSFTLQATGDGQLAAN